MNAPARTTDFDPRWSVPRVELRGMTVHAVREACCVERVEREMRARRGGWLMTINLDYLRRCEHDRAFAELLRKADLTVADGMPLVWASRIAGRPLPGRVAGSDLISSLSAAAARSGTSVFLLGGSPGAAQGAARVLTQRYPTLRIAGLYCPPMGFERDPAAVREVERRLEAAQPGLVFVALGAPKQEVLIHHARHLLPSAWWVGVGISFSFLCGQVRRAPRWAQRLGLEWLHRLCQEPRRLARRYLVDGLPYVARLMTGALWQRLSQGVRRVDMEKAT